MGQLCILKLFSSKMNLAVHRRNHIQLETMRTRRIRANRKRKFRKKGIINETYIFKDKLRFHTEFVVAWMQWLHTHICTRHVLYLVLKICMKTNKQNFIIIYFHFFFHFSAHIFFSFCLKKISWVRINAFSHWIR